MDNQKILIVSGAIFAVLVVAAILINNFVIASNLVFIGIVILFAPYSLARFFQFKKLHAYEDEFPIFLRDLAESQQAGLTLMQAMASAAKSEYGMLTPEVRRMYNQLTWNVPIDTALNNFSQRMKNSKVIVRAVIVILQANKSGGNVEQTMESLANNIESIKEVQQEKNTMLSQQVVMMYAIFFIFVGITIALVKFLVPLLQTSMATADTSGFGFSGFNSNPCSLCASNPDPACLGCEAFYDVSAAFGFGKYGEGAAYYKGLFFTMIVVQGLFSGLIAGQISSDSLAAGVRHSLIMLIAGIFSFILVTRIGFI